jgi:Holliday junction resolvase-like predicted endonuclease
VHRHDNNEVGEQREHLERITVLVTVRAVTSRRLQGAECAIKKERQKSIQNSVRKHFGKRHLEYQLTDWRIRISWGLFIKKRSWPEWHTILSVLKLRAPLQYQSVSCYKSVKLDIASSNWQYIIPLTYVNIYKNYLNLRLTQPPVQRVVWSLSRG